MDISKLIVLEYSRQQKCFHQTTLQESLKLNLGATLAGRGPDYIPIGIFETHEQASEAFRELESVIHHANGRQVA